mmetsp:Transcript_18638/g.39959  ORF Transcript_18638/g.39959 Transcript_18638/m.39959 type:complete len:163 (+) Transcript_18638:103-591(+)
MPSAQPPHSHESHQQQPQHQHAPPAPPPPFPQHQHLHPHQQEHQPQQQQQSQQQQQQQPPSQNQFQTEMDDWTQTLKGAWFEVILGAFLTWLLEKMRAAAAAVQKNIPEDPTASVRRLSNHAVQASKTAGSKTLPVVQTVIIKAISFFVFFVFILHFKQKSS